VEGRMVEQLVIFLVVAERGRGCGRAVGSGGGAGRTRRTDPGFMRKWWLDRGEVNCWWLGWVYEGEGDRGWWQLLVQWGTAGDGAEKWMAKRVEATAREGAVRAWTSLSSFRIAWSHSFGPSTVFVYAMPVLCHMFMTWFMKKNKKKLYEKNCCNLQYFLKKTTKLNF